MTDGQAADWRMEQVAQKAAKAAVRETLRMLGTDPEDQDQVNELRTALEAAKAAVVARNQRGTESRKASIVLLFGTAGTAFGAFVTWAIQHLRFGQ